MSKAEYVISEAKKGNPAGHICHAKECGVRVAPSMLMCAKHWRLVPFAEQRAIWRHFRPGQEKDKTPSKDYMLALRAAVDAVDKLEGRS